MIRGGKGGANTKAGLIYEKGVSITVPVGAVVMEKYQFLRFVKSEFGIDWKDKWTKQLLADKAIYIATKTRIYIIEMKSQVGNGSVDEKIQTCDFKKKQWTKLFEDTEMSVDFWYVLNYWFKQPKYADVLNYIESVGCRYFFDEIEEKEFL